MNKQLNDRVNALEALCIDLLIKTGLNPAQSRIAFDDYQIKYTQEAIDKRAAEAKAKALSENYRVVVTEFNDYVKAHYWELVFMTEKQRAKYLDDVWANTITGFELPEGSKSPALSLPEPTIEQLISRRTELIASIERVMVSTLEEGITHCEQAIADVSTRLERELNTDIAKLSKDGKIKPSELERMIKETKSDYHQRIRKNIQSNQRQIDSAKVSLKIHKAQQEQLVQVDKLLGAMLTK